MEIDSVLQLSHVITQPILFGTIVYRSLTPAHKIWNIEILSTWFFQFATPWMVLGQNLYLYFSQKWQMGPGVLLTNDKGINSVHAFI